MSATGIDGPRSVPRPADAGASKPHSDVDGGTTATPTEYGFGMRAANDITCRSPSSFPRTAGAYRASCGSTKIPKSASFSPLWSLYRSTPSAKILITEDDKKNPAPIKEIEYPQFLYRAWAGVVAGVTLLHEVLGCINAPVVNERIRWNAHLPSALKRSNPILRMRGNSV